MRKKSYLLEMEGHAGMLCRKRKKEWTGPRKNRYDTGHEAGKQIHIESKIEKTKYIEELDLARKTCN